MKARLINHLMIDHESISQCWPNDEIARDVKIMSYLCKTSGLNLFSPIIGKDTLPFPKDLTITGLRTSIAEYDKDFTLTYEEITDIKAKELLALSRETNTPIAVSYSGGMDSTLVMVALLKWATQADLKRIIVVTNKTAVWEYPSFFFKHIVPKGFTIEEYDHAVSKYNRTNFSQRIYVNGHPNDQLMIGLNSSSEMALSDKKWLTTSWRDLGQLKQYLSFYWPEHRTADWLISKLSPNIDSVGVPINSCYDFVRWINYNYSFISAYSAEYCTAYANVAEIPVEQWNTYSYPWFADNLYQQWAMKNFNNYELIMGTSLDQWKWPVKKYIYEYDRDIFYFKYKTKMGSTGRRTTYGYNLKTRVRPKTWVAIAQDQRFLNIEDNLDELIETLKGSLTTLV